MNNRFDAIDELNKKIEKSKNELSSLLNEKELSSSVFGFRPKTKLYATLDTEMCPDTYRQKTLLSITAIDKENKVTTELTIKDANIFKCMLEEFIEYAKVKDGIK